MVFSRVEGGGLSNALNVEIGPPPTFTPSGVTSAASPSVSGPLVPGGIHSIFGSNLAPDIALPGPPPLPFTLGGVTVEVNGVPAALFYVSPAQITFQAPWELDGFNRVPFTIINGTLVSSTGVVNVVKAAPALFSVNGRGTGQGNILIDAPDSPIAAPTGAFAGSRPARAGETIRIYGTGLGSPSAIPLDGYLPFVPAISRTPVVTIGGVQATVSISELARQTVGLYRIDAVIPRE